MNTLPLSDQVTMQNMSKIEGLLRLIEKYNYDFIYIRYIGLWKKELNRKSMTTEARLLIKLKDGFLKEMSFGQQLLL